MSMQAVTAGNVSTGGVLAETLIAGRHPRLSPRPRRGASLDGRRGCDEV